MKYYNLKVNVLLKCDIENFETYEKLDDLIITAITENKEVKKDKEDTNKGYVFCNLYPVEREAIYKKNKTYTFDIRSIKYNKIMQIKQMIQKAENTYFKVIKIELQVNKQRKIEKLITLTPTIITNKKGGYEINKDLDFIKEKILKNTKEKYKELYNINVDIDFIKQIKQINRLPIKIPYKNKKMLGNKFEIEVKNDQISQDLSYLILSMGMLEKNSNGFGFCRAK